jgi:hypothetical protein
MALAQTDLPELKRFNFFVSRRFEEGRERFRLHMGYFATLAEAEEWLAVVREIYPGAWAGEAPGRKLRERAAAAAAAQAQHAAGPRPAQPAARAPAPPPPEHVPVLHAAPPAEARAPAAAPVAARPAPAPRPAAAPPVRPAVAPSAPVARVAAPAAPPAPQAQRAPAAAPPVVRAAAKPQPAASAPKAPMAPAGRVSASTPGNAASAARPAAPPVPRATAALVAAVKQPLAPTAKPPAPAAKAPAAAAGKVPATSAARAPGTKIPTAPVAKAPAAPVAQTPPAAAAKPAAPAKPVFEDSNVREVLKALGDASATGETRLMKAPPPPREVAAPPDASLSDTQVLKMLETRRSEGSEPAPVEIDDSGIPLLKPDDTGTRQALKDAVTNNAAVSFAVQLQWSVWPVELDKMPPLAIFSAYTLYTVEGSRDGRKWYGVRLGFFSDAISAKQVASYVRSEFASVAVVPVSPEEKARATEQEIAATLATPVPTRSDPMDEFKLIDDAPQLPKPATTAGAAAPREASGLNPPPGKPVPKVAVGRTVPQPQAAAAASTRRTKAPAGRERKGQASLEETLEILGASDLQIDTGTGETINDSGVRHLRVEVQKNSPFSKLLERLSERMKKP